MQRLELGIFACRDKITLSLCVSPFAGLFDLFFFAFLVLPPVLRLFFRRCNFYLRRPDGQGRFPGRSTAPAQSKKTPASLERLPSFFPRPRSWRDRNFWRDDARPTHGSTSRIRTVRICKLATIFFFFYCLRTNYRLF